MDIRAKKLAEKKAKEEALKLKKEADMKKYIAIRTVQYAEEQERKKIEADRKAKEDEEARKVEEAKKAALKAQQDAREQAREAWKVSELKRLEEEKAAKQEKENLEAGIRHKQTLDELRIARSLLIKKQKAEIQAAKEAVPTHPKLRLYSRKAKEVVLASKEDARVVLKALETDGFRSECERIAYQKK